MLALLKKLLEEIGGVLLLLFFGMLFFTVVLVFVEWRFQQDAVVFQTIANLVSGFAGAFFGLMTKKGKDDHDPPPPVKP